MSITIINSKRRIRDFLVYDMEWIPGIMELRMIGVYDGNRYRCYRTVHDFFSSELTDKNRGKWFYAHFGGLADVQFVIHEIVILLRSIGYTARCLFSASSAIIVVIKRGKNAWYLIDSGRLLPDKLANIAKAIGMEKGSEDFLKVGDPEEPNITDEEYDKRCLARREWYATIEFNKLRIYNEQDCLILWTAISEFQHAVLELGGQLQMTLASCGMYLFRRKYLSETIETSYAVNQIAREAYTASRVEVFQSSIEYANYYDINSSFPHAMTYDLPGNYIGTITNRLPSYDECYIADVDIVVPETFVPPIPRRIASRIFFPIGRWRAWLSDIDIKLLLREGGIIKKCHEALIFETNHDLKNYAKDLYSHRLKCTSEFQRLVDKLFMNCLYGKFAECDIKQSMEIDPEHIDEATMHMVMPGIWFKENQVSVPNVHVPLSVSITAIARRSIFDKLITCNDIHYCDTDGFSTREELNTGEQLGDIKLEKKIRKGRFLTQKVYDIEGQKFKNGKWEDIYFAKAKGFSRMTASRFTKILEGEAIEYERMSRIKELIKKGKTKPEEIKVLKRIHMKSLYEFGYDPKKHVLPKRFHYPDGNTRPWSIDELNSLGLLKSQ